MNQISSATLSPLTFSVPLKHSQARSSTSARIFKITTYFTLRPSNFVHVAGGPEVLLFSLRGHSCLLSHLASVPMIICINISKAAVGLNKDLIFVAVYIPPYQSPYYKQTDTNCSIHHLEDFLLKPDWRRCLLNGVWRLKCAYWGMGFSDG